MGTQLPSPKWTQPQFSAHICCGQMDGWIKIPLGRDVDLGPSDIVLDGDPAPALQKRRQSPQFSAHVCGGQTAGWIKIPLGMELGLDPDHIVLDRDPAPPPKKGHSRPLFGRRLLWSNGWMDQDATWYEGRPRPRRHCVRWGSSYPQKGVQPPIFRPCLLWPNDRPSQLLMSTCLY